MPEGMSESRTDVGHVTEKPSRLDNDKGKAVYHHVGWFGILRFTRAKV